MDWISKLYHEENTINPIMKARASTGGNLIFKTSDSYDEGLDRLTKLLGSTELCLEDKIELEKIVKLLK